MKREIAILIRKFLIGKATNEEQEKLETWYQHPLQDAQQGQDAWPVVKKRIWQQIQKQVRPKHRVLVSPRWAVASAAASILIILTLSQLSIIKHGQVQEYRFTTQAGEVKEFHLDDGSLVWLNAESALHYTSKYGDKQRNVTLTGEALFDVKHNPDCPFVVNTDAGITRVLGTRFTVRAYTGEQQQVTLTRGSVKVSFPMAKETPDYLLAPGEMFSFNPESKETAYGHILPEQAEGWTKRLLYFNARPLSEIFATLERTYDVTIRTTQVDVDRTYTAAFNNEELSRILRSLGLSLDLSVKQVNNNTIEISSR